MLMLSALICYINFNEKIENITEIITNSSISNNLANDSVHKQTIPDNEI